MHLILHANVNAVLGIDSRATNSANLVIEGRISLVLEGEGQNRGLTRHRRKITTRAKNQHTSGWSISSNWKEQLGADTFPPRPYQDVQLFGNSTGPCL